MGSDEQATLFRLQHCVYRVIVAGRTTGYALASAILSSCFRYYAPLAQLPELRIVGGTTSSTTAHCWRLLCTAERWRVRRRCRAHPAPLPTLKCARVLFCALQPASRQASQLPARILRSPWPGFFLDV